MNRYGEYGITLAYPGEYQVDGQSVNVSEEAVRTGAYRGTYRTDIPFDEGEGSVTEDVIGSHEVETRNATWRNGIVGSALNFESSTEII